MTQFLNLNLENSLDFNAFLEQLSNYFIREEVSDENFKKATLLTLLPEKVFNLLESLCLPETVENCSYKRLCKVLEEHFLNKKSNHSSFMARLKFYTAQREIGESSREWAARLVDLAYKCNFGEEKNILIRDIFVFGYGPCAAQNRLFEEDATSPNTTIDKLVEIASFIETVKNEQIQPIKGEPPDDPLYIVKNELNRYSPTPPVKVEISHRARSQEGKSSGSNSSDKPTDGSDIANSKEKKQKSLIKKPLNAFMLYMKDMRAKVISECDLKESAAINQIIGRRWHLLSREEQAKYYEKARQERQLHRQLYPGWSSRDNYSYGSKKKRRKKKKERVPAEWRGNNFKKCRARYGLDQQNQWCISCRRKKRCVRCMEFVPLPIATAGPQNPCFKEDVKLEELSDALSDREVDAPLNTASSFEGLSALF